jgi:HEAT repeat protein
MTSDSASIVLAARWGSVALMVIVLLMMTYILCLRALLLMRERRYRDLAARWTPVMLGGEASHPRPLPHVVPGERFLLLILWNSLRERHEQDAGICDWMSRVAALTRIDSLARRFLAGRGVRKKLLAIVTLGQLRDGREWHRLCAIAQSGHPLLSLAATAAIARIDPAQATEMVVALVVRHTNWPAAKVASILKDLGAERVSEPLGRAILRAPESHRPGLIPFLAVCQYPTALATVRQLLREPHLDEVIAPCLHVVGRFANWQDLPLVYRYLTHARWHVRAVAAGCLGKMGRRADQVRLMPSLTDREWWVRYRAAQAIVRLSPHDDQRLREIQNTLRDRYARDILTQVIAEGVRPGQSGTYLSPRGRLRAGSSA